MISYKERDTVIKYKIDMFDILKKNRFNQTQIRHGNLLPKKAITNFKTGKLITLEVFI